jgi:hypothetical protein
MTVTATPSLPQKSAVGAKSLLRKDSNASRKPVGVTSSVATSCGTNAAAN